MKSLILLASVMICAALPVIAQVPAQPVVPATAPAKIIDVTPDEAEKQIAAGAVVIDLRTADEFEGSHIKGAKNLSSLDADFAKSIAALDPKTPVVVHCQSGRRSNAAVREVFMKSQLQTVYHMSSGLSGWTKAGKPVEKTQTPIQSGKLPDRLK